MNGPEQGLARPRRTPAWGPGQARFRRKPTVDTRGALSYCVQSTMRGIRGATQVSENTVGAIEDAVVEMCREICHRNQIKPSDIVWAIFTVTHDLDADFPARAARVSGWNAVPMICSQEIPVPGSMQRVIRVLLHVDSEGPRNHVYLRGAEALRPDLHRKP